MAAHKRRLVEEAGAGANHSVVEVDAFQEHGEGSLEALDESLDGERGWR